MTWTRAHHSARVDGQALRLVGADVARTATASLVEIQGGREARVRVARQDGRGTRPEVELRWIGERRGSTPPGEEAKAVDDGAGQTAFDVVGADRDGAFGQARCIDRDPTRAVDGVVGQDHVSGPGPTDVQSLRVSVDG